MASQSEGINIGQLGPEQLYQLKQQLDQEDEVQVKALQQLRVALNRLTDSRESVEALKKQKEGDTMLVPITQSMYVPGEAGDVKSVMVDIGTGYYVEKSVSEAEAYFDRKIKYVRDQFSKVQAIVSMNRQQLGAVESLLQQKLRAAQSQQQSASESS